MHKNKTIKELNAINRELARALDARYNQLTEDLIKLSIRDIAPLNENFRLTQLDENNSKLVFSKCYNNPSPIERNDEHEFCRKHALIHLKSNSICTWIPKNSCSTLRFSIAKSNGAISGIQDIDWIHKNNYSFSATNKELLAAEYTFVMLRNPFKRLLSFYCDKLCNKGINENDRSYEVAQSAMGTNAKTTFSDFVEILWQNPILKKKNEHIQDQCDFLVYKKYHDYFPLEKYKDSASAIRQRTGLVLEDVRTFNSIHTSYGCEDSVELNHDNPGELIGRAMEQSKKPIAKNMYSPDMIRKVGILYLNDIHLYLKTITNSEEEMSYWLKFMC